MDKARVAIVGGGPAALAVAWELTQSPGWAERFEIDVYTLGWRLGGKCASGRNPQHRWRNEEHGLHLLGGFYHNVFQVLGPLYEVWRQASPQAIPFAEAFLPHQGFTIAQPTAAGGWTPARVNMPVTAGQPGVNARPLSVATMLDQLWQWIAQALGRVRQGLPLLDWNVTAGGAVPFVLQPLHDDAARQLQQEFETLSRGVQPLSPQAAHDLAAQRGLQASERLRAFANDKLPVLEGVDWRQVLKFLAALSSGILRDGVLLRGFDALNGWEAADWLRERGGADDEAVACPLFQASYHYAFAYVDGQPDSKNIAAGAGMRGLMRMLFTYQGTVFQHMNGGMGEVFCAPFYEVLKDKVRFHFFHRLEALVPDGTSIGALEFLVQADAKGGSAGYDPLLQVAMPDGRSRSCFPTSAIEDRLANPEQVRGIDLESWWGSAGVGRRKTLVKGAKDDGFDLCVLAVPAGVLPLVSGQLAASAPWKAMLGGFATTPTVSAQLWRKDRAGSYGGLTQDGLFTAYALPHSTWADISFQQAGEAALPEPSTLSILCGPVPVAPQGTRHDAQFPALEQQRAEQVTDQWLAAHAAAAMPGAAPNGSYDAALEYERYTRMNSDPVSLYVLTPKGTVASRLRCDASGYSNLLLAGDWTRNNLDMGAVEGAVQSGRLCARALCGFPQDVYGERDV